jgi:hypothetical protein
LVRPTGFIGPWRSVSRPALGHHLDGQAAVEIAGRFPGLELGLVGGEQRVDEGLVIVPVIGQLI